MTCCLTWNKLNLAYGVANQWFIWRHLTQLIALGQHNSDVVHKLHFILHFRSSYIQKKKIQDSLQRIYAPFPYLPLLSSTSHLWALTVVSRSRFFSVQYKRMKCSQHIWPEAFVLRWLCITTVAVGFLFSKRKQDLMFFSFPFLSMALVVHILKQGRFHYFCDQFPAALLCNIQKNTWQMYKIILSLPKQCETWDASKPPSPLSGSPFSFSAVLWDIYKHFDSFLPLYHLRWMLSCQIIQRAALIIYGCHRHAGTFVFRSTQRSFGIFNRSHVIKHLAQPPSDRPLFLHGMETAWHWLVFCRCG